MEGKKYDNHKLRFDLMPVYAMHSVAEVFTYGANKYGDRNWETGLSWLRLFAAVMRHLWRWRDGFDEDEESGLPHLAHAAAGVLMLLEYWGNEGGRDDRVTHIPQSEPQTEFSQDH
jgi:hypothetical protein